MSEEEGEPAPEITIDARRFAGVWANAVRMNGGSNEITIDFARMDPVESRGMVAARVTCSPGFLRTQMGESRQPVSAPGTVACRELQPLQACRRPARPRTSCRVRPR